MADETFMEAVDGLIDRGVNGITSLTELAQALEKLDPRQKAESWRRGLRRARKQGATESLIRLTARAFEIAREELPDARPRPASVAEVAEHVAALEAALRQAEARLDQMEARLAGEVPS